MYLCHMNAKTSNYHEPYCLSINFRIIWNIIANGSYSYMVSIASIMLLLGLFSNLIATSSFDAAHEPGWLGNQMANFMSNLNLTRRLTNIYQSIENSQIFKLIYHMATFSDMFSSKNKTTSPLFKIEGNTFELCWGDFWF